MDELFGGLVMLAFFATVIAILIGIALAMVAASAAIGGVIVAIRGFAAFVSALAARIKTRGGTDRRPKDPEPAYEIYALGQFQRDLRGAYEEAWAAMHAARRSAESFASSLDDGVTMPLSIGIVVGAYVGMGVGAVLNAVLTLPFVLVGALVIAGAWCLIGLLRLAEAIRRVVRRTGYECPVDHKRFPLPVYVCPGCGAQHARLVPGRWGILKRECRCGRVALPTMVLNGRQRVPQQCPEDGHPMSGLIGFTEMVRIALVAGPSAGKSTLLAGTLHELDRASKEGRLALNVVEDSRRDFETALASLAGGKLPEKTAASTRPALVAEIQGGGRSRVLSLYDVAGEAYAGDDAIRDLRFLEVPSGLVLVVDPLSIDRVATDQHEEISGLRDRLLPSPVRPIRALEATLGALVEAGAKPDKIPVAVVIGKADALGIGEEIAALAEAHGEDAPKHWLEAQGAGNFVRAVEAAFDRVGWFSASALGRVPDPADRRAFNPVGTAAPVLWLLKEHGITPAATPFKPSQHAERLGGAGAADFPPLSRGSLAWRGAVALTLAVGVLSGVGVAMTSAIGGGMFDGVVSFASAEDDADETDGSEQRASRATKTSQRDGYAVTMPKSWKSVVLDVRRTGYRESVWRAGGSRETRAKVNYTRGVSASAAASARSVRNIVRRNRSDYSEIAWRSARIDGRPAWWWEFSFGGRRKVDVFVNDDCDTGYAILVETTGGQWDKYARTLKRIVRSLDLEC